MAALLSVRSLSCLSFAVSLQCSLGASRAGLALADRPAGCDKLYVRCEVDSITRMFELLSKASFAG